MRALAALDPGLAAAGHGHPMSGAELSQELTRLARNFDEAARPPRGWYRRHPVPVGRARAGTPDPLRTTVLAALAGLGALWFLAPRRRK